MRTCGAKAPRDGAGCEAGHGLTRVLSFPSPSGRRDQMTAFIGRREFITLLGGASAAWPLVARAQQPGRIARVGVLGPDLSNPVTGPGYQVFLSEMRKLGFTEGQNLVIEYRRTDEGLPKAFT